MDEILKRRLAGAAVLLAIAFVLSLLLPKPGHRDGDAGDAQGVVFDLTQPATAQGAPEPAVPAPEPEPLLPERPEENTGLAEAEPLDAASPEEESQVAQTADQQAAAPPPDTPVAGKVPPVTQEKPDTRSPAVATKPPPAAPPQVVVPPARSTWYIQVGSFSDINNARQAQESLRPAQALIVPAETPVGTSYRVRLGPYASKERAVTERDRLAPQASVVEN